MKGRARWPARKGCTLARAAALIALAACSAAHPAPVAQPSSGAGAPRVVAEKPLGIAVHGRVVDAHQRPVAGASVALTDEATEALGPTTVTVTSADGSFIVHVPRGTYALTASGGGQAYRSGVVVDRSAAAVDLVLDDAAVIFRGHVFAAGAASPPPGAIVTAARVSQNSGDAWSMAPASDGSFALDLPAGDFEVSFRAPGFETEYGAFHMVEPAPIDISLERAAPAEPAPAAAIRALGAHATALRSTAPGAASDDLAALGAKIGEARVVALGEATHGTREFFRMKHRIFEYLVTQKGFSVFAMEAALPEGFDVDDYVSRGRGDPEHALAGLTFWTWATEEVADLLRWMRAYNLDPRHPKKVSFCGIDAQFTARAARFVQGYLARSEPALAAQVRDELDVLASPLRARERRSSATMEALEKAVQRVGRELDAGTMDRERALARQHTKVLAQTLGIVDRDRAMADNALWALDRAGPGAKMVIWAHNDHIGKVRGNTGGYLDAALGKDFRAFGFAFGHGSFRAMDADRVANGVRILEAPPTSAESADHALGALGAPLAFVDTPALAADADGGWFASRRPTRSFGAYFSTAQASAFGVAKRALGRSYDGVIYVDETTPSRPLPFVREHNRIAVGDGPKNLWFEEEGAGAPGWSMPAMASMAGFRIGTSEDHPHGGRRAGVVQRAEGAPAGEAVGSLMQTIDAQPLQGRRVALHAFVRADRSAANLRVWLDLARTPAGWIDRELTRERVMPAEAASSWVAVDLTLDVPDRADRLSFGLQMEGTGRAFLDDVTLSSVERAAP